MTEGKTQPCPPFASAALLLADGTVFFGRGVGASGTAVGELCFNTSVTGYQEVVSDPSYAGQIIAFTFPHIGNVGANDEDIEAEKIHASGLVLREPPSLPSNFRATDDFDDWLKEHGVIGISGVDTRAITRHIRLRGAQGAAICHASDDEALNIETARSLLEKLPSMEGLELAKKVTTSRSYSWEQTLWKLGEGYGTCKNPKHHVVAVDYGGKLNILRSLASVGCRVTVVPATTKSEAILGLKPDGIFLSNGPGDPEATGRYAVPILKKLIASGVPMFGICLGHQLLALALGADTEKMHQGHRGANHPVKDMDTGKVEITSQNHGFVVTHGSLTDAMVPTRTSLFDGTLEGFRIEGKPIFAVQYHPESSPGPHDSRYLFERFVEMMHSSR